MKKIVHLANERGHANLGWLDTYYSFSFSNYYDPAKIHFGALRVLNDDIIQADKGFGTHPHDNMEIITIPLSGSLAHKDSMGNGSVITAGEIQIMSAGTGITHSEFNHSSTESANILQIWVFPNKKQVIPRYQQFNFESEQNQFKQIVSPNVDDEGGWIHQDGWLFLGTFDKSLQVDYKIKKPDNGIYVFVISGKATIAGTTLNEKDAIGLYQTDAISIISESDDTRLLLIDIPMSFTAN